MAAPVLIEVGTVCDSFAADIADILFPAVDAQVLSKSAFLSEAFIADIALIGFLPGVDALVCRAVGTG